MLQGNQYLHMVDWRLESQIVGPIEGEKPWHFELFYASSG